MITSLLDLQAKKKELEKEIRDLISCGHEDTAEYGNAEWNLRDTQKAIDAWGKEANVSYRIC